MKFNKTQICFSIAILTTAMLFSCNREDEVLNYNLQKTILPSESALNIEAIHSDSGIIKIFIISPQLDKYTGENTYTEFPKGIKVIHYDSIMNVKSFITADYAKIDDTKKLLEARRNVVIIDKDKGVTINTERIYWDQNRKIIFSDTFVKKTSKEGIMYGNGFDADETFSRYTIRNPKGDFNIDIDKPSLK